MEIGTWRDKEFILKKKLVVQFRGEIAQRRIYRKMSLKRGGEGLKGGWNFPNSQSGRNDRKLYLSIFPPNIPNV